MDNIIPISEAKGRLSKVVRDSQDTDVVLVRHGHPAAVVIGVDRFRALLEQIEDLADQLAVFESRESDPTMRLSLDKVRAELGMNG